MPKDLEREIARKFPWLPINGEKRIAAYVESLLIDRAIETAEELKYQPTPKQIPCPDGIAGCLVMHYGQPSLSYDERAFNDRIDRYIELQKEKELL